MAKKTITGVVLALLLSLMQNVVVPIGVALVSFQSAQAKSGSTAKVNTWFQRYDQIRREAQMSPSEKERSTSLMTAGIAASFMQSTDAAQDKAAANALLTKMVNRYVKASAQMAALPRLGETKKLYDGYSLYFHNAGALFADYLKLQNNLFARDANGNSLMGQLTRRKTDLEALDAVNKNLDARLRAKYGIAPYAY
jgi:hypothetical protein